MNNTTDLGNNIQQLPTGQQNMKTLAAWYGQDYKTFRKWLKGIPGLTLAGRATRNFKPDEIRMIVAHLGEPIKD